MPGLHHWLGEIKLCKTQQSLSSHGKGEVWKKNILKSTPDNLEFNNCSTVCLWILTYIGQKGTTIPSSHYLFQFYTVGRCSDCSPRAVNTGDVMVSNSTACERFQTSVLLFMPFLCVWKIARILYAIIFRVSFASTQSVRPELEEPCQVAMYRMVILPWGWIRTSFVSGKA